MSAAAAPPVGAAALGFDVKALATMKRRELQALAKRHHIKANLKSKLLIQKLKQAAWQS